MPWMTAPPTGQRPDPYLDWAEATNFGGHGAAAGRGDGAKIPVLVELARPIDDKTWPIDRVLKVPAAYAAVASAQGRTFCSGVVQRGDLTELAKNASIKRLTMSLPIDASTTDTVLSIGPDKGQHAASGRLVLGVIDRGCAFLNRAFCRRGAADKTRLLALWDQGRAATTADWHVPGDFGYGRVLDTTAIDKLLPAATSHAAEEAIYRRLRYLARDAEPLPAHLHGTHVLDTLGGLGTVMTLPGSAKPAQDDAAASADIVFVNVPELGTGDNSGASSDAHVLDALHFILDRAGPGARVVINLSIGAQAGPHDGSSSIERAFDELMLATPGLLIVNAAGNGRHSQWSASGTLTDDVPGQAVRLDWRTLPGDVTDSFMEIWFSSEGGAKGVPGVSLCVTTPWGEPSGPIGPGQALHYERDGGVLARLALPPWSALGDGPMALLALAPSDGRGLGAAEQDSRRPASGGRWIVELSKEAADHGDVAFDIWVQRDEPPDGLALAVQSRLDRATGAEIDGGSTLSSLSSAQWPIAVGALRLDESLSTYSAELGPRASARVTADVDALAPADESPTVLGLLASAVLSGTVFRMSGTSVAAPVLARHAANWLAAQTALDTGNLLRTRFLASLDPIAPQLPGPPSPAPYKPRSLPKSPRQPAPPKGHPGLRRVG
jgi:hypothetical protein